MEEYSIGRGFAGFGCALFAQVRKWGKLSEPEFIELKNRQNCVWLH